MKINTVLFDIGGTLDDITYDDQIRLNASRELLDYLREKSINIPVSVEVFWDDLRQGNAEYYKWNEQTGVEASPFEIWSKFHLQKYNIPDNLLKEVSDELAVIWETKFYQRKLKKEAPQVLQELKNRGYKLGIISNTTSRTEVIRLLEIYGIKDYFQCFVLSSVHGHRKPEVSIFQEGLKLMGSVPEKTAYVGDTISRDIIGAKAAGFGMAILIKSFLTKEKDSEVGEVAPDYVIPNLNELLDILV